MLFVNDIIVSYSDKNFIWYLDVVYIQARKHNSHWRVFYLTYTQKHCILKTISSLSAFWFFCFSICVVLDSLGRVGIGLSWINQRWMHAHEKKKQGGNEFWIALRASLLQRVGNKNKKWNFRYCPLFPR